MKIGVPKEIHVDENRVATTPDVARQLIDLGYQVSVEAGAGGAASFNDQAYTDVGVEIIEDTKALWKVSDIILKVRPPEFNSAHNTHEADWLSPGQMLISFIWPAQNTELVDQMKARGATVMAMDAVPRISRAQKLDALSSMSNIAGYRSVIEAGYQFGRFFTGQVTAAGKVPPAKVMVIGAGVAGLAAIGTAHSLGAIVRAFDTRPEVKEQVESMGAEFLELDFEEEGSGEGGYAKEMSQAFIEAEMALFMAQAKEVDIIITTALIPGKPAPKLITADMVKAMKPGSVIVDLAAEQGGNCELTTPGEVVQQHGVTVVGYTDLPSRLPAQASQLYATNLRHLLVELTPDKDGEPLVDMEDDVIRGVTVVKDGEITWPPDPPIQITAVPATAKEPAPIMPAAEVKKPSGYVTMGLLAIGVVLILALGTVAPASFMSHFTVFVLACFVGWQVIWNVTPALHTPLMSVTNAISGIIVIGALIQVGAGSVTVVLLAAISILIATVNVFGGFLVTQRMLKMFRK
ncbi:MAG: Re/Si-specific NAD(P)(+) transhydrogenase subunit alpha [Arenicellales bacterium]|nr:Re/Si-specific NAD(P)(+) transhydrogenase subunit alpha [Arenicellales bacterium]